ncbi:MAG: potassium channel family protein [Saprospiraceae bacterium]
MDVEEENQQNQDEPLSSLNLIIFVLSIYVLVALMVDTFYKLSPEVSSILETVDNLICVIFLYDFAIRFRRAPNKLKFMRWGWIDLLSSIPFVDYVRAGRVLRLFRLLRIIRAFKNTHQLVNHIYRKRAQGALATAFIITILMLIFSSIAILQVETDPHSNIKTAEDALWWSVTTITTVGYGDRYPVTTEGRIISTILMVMGIGLFGTFSGYISSVISQHPEHHHHYHKEDADDKKDSSNASESNNEKS